jgi:copper transport protein
LPLAAKTRGASDPQSGGDIGTSRSAVALLAAAVACGCWATPAFAHANLVSTSPQDGAVVASAPKVVRVRFDDPVTVGPGNAVVGANRRSVLAGRPRVERGGHELVLPLRTLGDGDYSARWGIVSDDGHAESGVLAFRVGSATSGAGPPQSVLTAESERPSTENVFARWLFLGGILVAGGVALFRLLVSRAAARQAASTVTFALGAVVLGGSWLLLTTDAEGTRFGHVVGAAGLIAAAGMLAAAFSTMRPRLQQVATGSSLVLLAAPTFAGHAARVASDRPLSVAADLVHVVAAAFWIGGLLQLAAILRAGDDPGAARRFSRLALPAVALLALSGAARAVVELTGVSQLWSTGYGRALLIKSVLLGCLIVLAWLSRRRIGSGIRLLRTVSAELAVLAVVIGVVAVLTGLRPARDVGAQPKPVVSQEVAPAALPIAGSVTYARQSGELAVALAVRPGRALRLVATVLGRSGRGIDGLDVRFSATNAAGRQSASARGCGHGCYAASFVSPRPKLFRIDIAGAGPSRSVVFPVVGSWPPPPGTAFLRRATRRFLALRSAVYVERLASGPDNAIRTTWRLEAPDRLAYAIRGGAEAIVIGRTRWDRPTRGARWQRSETTPLVQPFPPWGTRMAQARVLRGSGSSVTLSWLDRTVPAWYTGTFDRTTALPSELRMTAAAHFMRQRFRAYDRKLRIESPLP